MKSGIVCILILVTSDLFSQSGDSRKVELRRKLLYSEVNTVTNKTADQALKIAAYLFNSKDFQDSVLKLSFPYKNHCLECGTGEDSTATISGHIVLDSIFRQDKVSLILNLEKAGKQPLRIFKVKRCWSLGHTCPDTDSITSYYDNINCDMGEDLPFAYAYAVHLCHEYIHNVGFCHTDHELENDIAEAVGWIAFYYVKTWYDRRVRI